jgi:acetyl-CoA acyltransferase 2
LQPSFIENGAVTAGNASGICDGAAAVLLAGEEAVKKYGLTPIARIVSWGIVGVDPAEMGIGPVNAIKFALLRANMKLDDIGLIEINEAFAAQYLAVEKELELNRDKTNLQGGAIAIGHPLGASGSRIAGHLAYQLRSTGKRYGVGAACIGGGQGIAVLLEAVDK